ncbi:Adenylosuccinate synthetase, partial [Rhizoctonia solani]
MPSGPPSRLYAWVYLARKYAELLVRLPFIGIWYIPKSNRPYPGWSWGRALLVYVANFTWEIPYRTGRLLDRDINREVPAKECMGTKFMWIQPVPEHFIQGEIKGYAESAKVKPCRIPAYGFGDWGQEKLLHARDSEKIVMHCHGGAYVSRTAHPEDLTAGVSKGIVKFSKPTISRTLSIEYRLSSSAPWPSKWPFPTGLIDALSGYHYLINTLGFKPQNIIISGDSAGGNLVLGLVRYLRDNPQIGLPLPGGLLLVSPWCDLGETHLHQRPDGLSVKNHDRRSDFIAGDWISSDSTLRYGIRSFLGSHLSPTDARKNPYISPASLDLDEQIVATMFDNFPRTYLVYGEAEILVDENRTLYERMVRNVGPDRIVKDEVPDAMHDVFALEIWEPEYSEAHRRIVIRGTDGPSLSQCARNLWDIPARMRKMEPEKVQVTTIENKSVRSLSLDSRPKATWSEEEERRLIRKLDWRILPVVIIFVRGAQLTVGVVDRTNVGNAKVAGLEKDIGLVGYQYNIGLSIFYITYALSEVPSNLLLKRIGADKWIPILVTGFGLVCFCTTFIRNFAGFMVVRALLGLWEGGMMPGVTFYLSTYYKRHELVFRIGIFVSASSLSGAFGGLLASGLLKIPQLKGIPSGAWRNIFEGAITMALGLAAFHFLPGPAERTKFLNEREKMIAIQRLMQDEDNGNTAGSQAAKGDSWWRAFKSLNTWICAICFLLNNMTVQGISLFMPTLLKGMGYSTIQSQLRTVPPYVVASVFSIAIAYGSFRSGRRGMWLLFIVPLVITGLAILLGTSNSQANYAGVFLIAMGAFPQGPILLSWATNNSAPNTVRAVSSALVVAIGTMGPIVTSWIYLPSDSPRYPIATGVQVGAQGAFFILASILILHNIRENRRRARGERDYRLNASEEEVARLGSLHPSFRLATPSRRRSGDSPPSKTESITRRSPAPNAALAPQATSPILLHRLLVLSLLSALVGGGTIYSIVNNTYKDTSDPLLAHLPHHLADYSYFARKSNIFNQLFVKKAWGWTSGAFFALWFTSPGHLRKPGRVVEWLTATGIWALFTMWFFGPSLFHRLASASGAQCVVFLPPSPDASSNIVNVPVEFCQQHTPVSPSTHPALFASNFVLSRLAGTHSLDPNWRAVPTLYSGHDISGHMFLLTMSIFFLAEQISLSLPLLYPSLEPVPGTVRHRASFLHEVVVKASGALLGIWFLMSLTTAVYFHTPFEKATGFLAGLLAAYIIKLPVPILSRAPPPAPPIVALDKPEI